ncbi:MAG: hypothetical protein ACI8XO_002306 [Verrucomicrobiales bacterium]|jgi:hypothetical protein
MISDHFWKFILFLILTTCLIFWYRDYEEKRATNNLVWELADLVSFTAETRPSTLGEAHSRFVKAVTLLHTNRMGGAKVNELLDAVFENNGLSIDGAKANLIRHALLDSEKIAKELGVFNEDSIWDLEDGHLVKITNGPFAGENFAIVHRVPATIGKGAEFFIGNFLIVPESVAAVTQDFVLTEDVLSTAFKLSAAEVLRKEDANLIKKNYSLQRESNKY